MLISLRIFPAPEITGQTRLPVGLFLEQYTELLLLCHALNYIKNSVVFVTGEPKGDISRMTTDLRGCMAKIRDYSKLYKV